MQISPWFQVILTFHRFIICKYPKNSELMNKFAFWVKLLLATCFFISIFSIVKLFFNLKIDEDSFSNNQTLNGSIQKAICTTNSLLLVYSELESFLFRVFLPFLLIFILTIILYRNIYRKVLNYPGKRQIQRENHFTYTVIVSNLFFLVSFTPVLIIFILKYSNITKETQRYTNIIEHIGYICLEFSNLYYATFFFWNLVFNSLFRRQVFYIGSSLIKKFFVVNFKCCIHAQAEMKWNIYEKCLDFAQIKKSYCKN